MAFYGVKVVPGKTSWIEASHDEPIQLRNACLVNLPNADKTRIVIRMCDESQNDQAPLPAVGILSSGKDGIENLNLDLLVNSKMGVTLGGTNLTGAEVHLVGNFLDEADDSDDDAFGLHDEDIDLPEALGMDLQDFLNAGGAGSDSNSESDDDDDEDMSDSSDDEGSGGGGVGGAGSKGGDGKPGSASQPGGGTVVPRKGSGLRPHPSGLRMQDLMLGTGRSPTKGRNVAIEYKLRVESGKVVDKSGKAPFKFRLGIGEVIKGMDIGVGDMREGGERHLVIPPRLGYGKRGAPPKIPKNATLYFDVKLIRVW